MCDFWGIAAKRGDMAAETGRRQGRPGENSNFAVACTLLSQYIKAKRDPVDLGLGVGSQDQLVPKGQSEFARPPATMALLPGVNVSAGERLDVDKTLQNVMELFAQSAGFRSPVEASEEDARDRKRSQLTIFYGGRVLVFDKFPADKAKNLMQLASNGASSMQNSSFMPPSPTSDVVHTNAMSNRNSNLLSVILNNSVVAHEELTKSGQSSSSNLPIARKSSLQRFLEKRKDRTSAKAPYQVSGYPASSNPVKRGDDESWLGLGQ